jgi:hypothetical protein
VCSIQGSTLLPLLLKQPDKYTISALVRSDAAANYLKSVDVTPIVGSLDDADTLRIAAMNADVVLNLADADHLEGAKALITGLKSKSGECKLGYFRRTLGICISAARNLRLLRVKR